MDVRNWVHTCICMCVWEFACARACAHLCVCVCVCACACVWCLPPLIPNSDASDSPTEAAQHLFTPLRLPLVGTLMIYLDFGSLHSLCTRSKMHARMHTHIFWKKKSNINNNINWCTNDKTLLTMINNQLKSHNIVWQKRETSPWDRSLP